MKQKIRATVALVAIVLALFLATGFARADNGDIFGTAIGAGAGGFLGNQIGHGSGNVAATLGGVVLGGYAGNEISHSFGHSPPRYAPAFYDYPPPVNTTYVPNYVAPPAAPPPPSPIYTDMDSGAYCREYSETVRIGNRVQESYGTACLQPDGSWRVVQ